VLKSVNRVQKDCKNKCGPEGEGDFLDHGIQEEHTGESR